MFGQKEISVVISSKFITRGGAFYGVDIGLVNIESGEFYFSNILSIFKQRHSIIENLPPGRYQVFYFQGMSDLHTTDKKLKDYFGVLEFESGKYYYLGNFIGRKGFTIKSEAIYTIEDSNIPKGVIRFFKKRKLIEKEEIIRTYPYNMDSLIIN